MTADCTFSSSNVGSGAAFLYFSAGEFTINGHGYSIIGPSSTWTIYVQNAGTVLNLNNVTIRGNTSANNPVAVAGGARLNARNVIFRDNATTGATLLVNSGSEAHLEDVQFNRNEASTGSIISISNSTVVLTNGIFRFNTSSNGRIISLTTSGARLNGSGITFSDNSAIGVITTVDSNVQATLQNVQFLNNRQTSSPDTWPNGSVITARTQSTVTITNGIFRGNRNVAGQTNVITTVASSLDPVVSGKVNLQGCITFANNVQSDGSTAANDYTAYGDTGNYVSAPLTGRITDSRTGVCPPNFQAPKKKKKEEEISTPTATPRPAYGASYVALQTATGMTFEATYGLDSGVHFRQLDGAGIGIQSIIDAGYLAALDVYGYVEQGVEVCFPQIGRVLFLDARTMPRAITPLDANYRDGMTCVTLNSPGSLVLLPN